LPRVLPIGKGGMDAWHGHGPEADRLRLAEHGNDSDPMFLGCRGIVIGPRPIFIGWVGMSIGQGQFSSAQPDFHRSHPIKMV